MTRLSDYLAGAGLVPVETLRSALARQAVYGGALDTALLEIGALEEGRLWQALGAATGLPLPAPRVYETPIRFETPAGAVVQLHETWSERWRAVPLRQENGAVAVLCGEPVAQAELESAGTTLGIPLTLFVVPEVRLAALRQAVYGRPMPARLVQLFARVAGAQPVRRWQAAQTRSPGSVLAAVSAATADGPAGGTAARDGGPPELGERGGPAPGGSSGQGTSTVERVDGAEMAALLERLDGRGEEAAKARVALVHLTKQDLGPKRRRWQAWWNKHQDDARVEWLFEGLGHKEPEIRASSEEELRALTGEYFGYHFDLPRPEREQAAARWQSWWYESGRARRG